MYIVGCRVTELYRKLKINRQRAKSYGVIWLRSYALHCGEVEKQMQAYRMFLKVMRN